MNRTLTVGISVLAGAALVETALLPGLLIGGGAVLAAKYLPKVLPEFPSKPRRRQAKPASKTPRRSGLPALLADRLKVAAPLGVPARLGIKRAIAKTITFRVLVTTLDFTSNYVVIGEFTTAAGLSAFALIVGPLFYLAHESAWNYYGPDEAVSAIPIRLSLRGDGDGSGPPTFTISRALAKTITFRTIATAMDFTATYVVVGDPLIALGLSAFGFVLGPFVYFGHEKAWDYYFPDGEGPRDEPAPAELPTRLLPAPA
jgi:uncharacterized membrane protein